MGVSVYTLSNEQEDQPSNWSIFVSRQSEDLYGMASKDSETVHMEKDGSEHSRPSKRERQY
jgi:hypothetical protein